MSAKSRRRRSTELRHLRSLAEVAPDAMLAVDQAGMIVLVNSQAERLFGYHQEEILGRPVEVLIPERFRERHRGHRVEFSAEPRVRAMGAKLQLFGLRKDGTEFPVEISLSPIETADGILVTSAIRDITERRLAEESRLRLATIVESSDDAIPAALRAQIQKRLGWHTLRHTFGTLVKSQGADVATTQALLRHANVSITMDRYVQAVTPAKREAQSRIVRMIPFPEKDVGTESFPNVPTRLTEAAVTA